MSSTSGGGRYQRSTSGLVGALIVTLLVVGAFVVWRALNRDQLEVKPEKVDYLASVEAIQGAGDSVAYPPTLPRGWICTSANYRPGRDKSWDLGALTPDNRFAGLQERDASVEQLVETYIDKDAEEGAPVRLRGALAGTWRSFSDKGGDYGLAAEVGQQTLLVYGNAGEQAIRELAASLVTDKLTTSKVATPTVTAPTP